MLPAFLTENILEMQFIINAIYFKLNIIFYYMPFCLHFKSGDGLAFILSSMVKTAGSHLGSFIIIETFFVFITEELNKINELYWEIKN